MLRSANQLLKHKAPLEFENDLPNREGEFTEGLE